jgi:hypothetical protein
MTRLPPAAYRTTLRWNRPTIPGHADERYRTSPKEVTSRLMVDSLRRKDFAHGVVVTPFDEAL